MIVMGDTEPALSVVIATFNGEHVLRVQLQSLANQVIDDPFEVIVADNGSSDRSLDVAREFEQRLDLRVVDASARRGQAFARNTGVATARSGLIIFLDQDDMVAPGYLASMYTALTDAPLVAARMETHVLNPGWVAEARDVVQSRCLPTDPVPWGYGCSLGIRKPLFDEVGGFDDELPFAAEDVDLCWRLHDLGVTTTFVPEAVLHYRFPRTAPALFRQGFRYGIAQGVVDRKHSGRSTFSATRWARASLGSARMAISPRSRGRRGRGAFLLGRRLGELRARAIHSAG